MATPDTEQRPPAAEDSPRGGRRVRGRLRRGRRPGFKRIPGLEIVIIAMVAIGLAIGIQAFAVKPYRIPSASMKPTLTIGQRVLVDRVSGHFSSPTVGDVVVFHPPRGALARSPRCGVAGQGLGTRMPCSRTTAEAAGATFIKRVVGVGGDRISIVAGHVIRNGHRERDPDARPCGPAIGCDFPEAIAVPRGHIFVMGDNRGNSDDSRYWGPVPTSWVIGEAFATYWPPSRIGSL